MLYFILCCNYFSSFNLSSGQKESYLQWSLFKYFYFVRTNTMQLMTKLSKYSNGPLGLSVYASGTMMDYVGGVCEVLSPFALALVRMDTGREI